MNEVTMDLTSVASLSISDSVRDHFWPIISESSESIYTGTSSPYNFFMAI